MLASLMARDSQDFKDLGSLTLFANPAVKSRLLMEATEPEDIIARLDERLTKSPIQQGWRERMDFADATASLWVEGELVSIEDLILHDAGMDQRVPDQQLTRAHQVLRLRRRIFSQQQTWTLSRRGIETLSGREPVSDLRAVTGTLKQRDAQEISGRGAEDELELTAALSAIDRAIDQSNRRLANQPSSDHAAIAALGDRRRSETDPLDIWLKAVESTRALPPVLAAAVALCSWEELDPVPNWGFLGRLLTASLLRERGKTRAFLAPVNVGLKGLPLSRRREKDPIDRVSARLEALKDSARFGLAEHERWVNARAAMLRKLANRRKSSHLPELIDFVMRRPIVTCEMAAAELKITPRAAQMLVHELELRETTGRSRYRGWSII